MKTKKIIRQLELLIEDFETGYIANPSSRADKRRDGYLKMLKELGEALRQAEEGK